MGFAIFSTNIFQTTDLLLGKTTAMPSIFSEIFFSNLSAISPEMVSYFMYFFCLVSINKIHIYIIISHLF